MPERFHYDTRVLALSEQQRGAGMAQIVETLMRQARLA